MTKFSVRYGKTRRGLTCGQAIAPACLAIFMLCCTGCETAFASESDIHACLRGWSQVPATADQTPARVVLVGRNAQGDLRLEDGRLVRLRSVQAHRLDDPARTGDGLAGWTGQLVALHTSPDSRPDRWGRIMGDITAPFEAGTASQAPTRHLGLDLLRSGEALVEPGHPDMHCRAALASAEQDARLSQAGLWSDPARQAALKGEDAAALRAMTGRFLVIEGRILSISERNTVVYLNFARRWRDGLTVTVPRRLWRDMGQAGWTKAAAEDRLVRVRGVVEETANGPVLVLSSGAAIEAID